MRLDGVFAQIRVGNKAVEEYPHTGGNVQNQADCWIPSSQGCNFEIAYGLLPGTSPKAGLRLMSKVHLDGIHIATFGAPLWDSTKPPKDFQECSVILSGIPNISTSTLLPFRFEPRMFKEGAAEEIPNGLGTVKLVLEWKRLTQRVSKSLELKANVAKRTRLLKTVSEELLKDTCSMDAVGLGASRPEPKRFGVWFNAEVAGLDALTFVFHYAQPGVLEAKGIIPTTHAPVTPDTTVIRVLPPPDTSSRTSLKRTNSHGEADASHALKTARMLNALANYTPAKRQRVKSDPDSATELFHSSSRPLMDELSRLNDRAEELNMEIENRPMFGRQRQYVDLNAALQDRVLILELSRLVNDFQRSIKKLQTHEMNNCDNGTSLVYIGVDSLDGDQEIVGELITAQIGDTSRTEPLGSTHRNTLQEEATKLDRRARELDQEVQNQSTIGQREGSTNANIILLSRMLILELSRLVRGLQDLAQKLLNTRQASCGGLKEKGKRKAV